MTFKYTAYNWQGRKVTGVLDTDSEEDAYERLRREDLIPQRLKLVRPRRSLVQIAPSLFKPGDKELVDFSRQLSSLLDAGIPLLQSIIVLRDESRGRGFREALNQVINDVESGLQFSEACAKQTSVFPTFYIRLLRVAEATGGINETLRRLADSVEKRLNTRRNVKKAVTYPAISMVVAFIAGFILVTYALPSLIGLLAEFGGEMPLMTRMLIGFSDFAQDYGVFVFVFAALAGVGAWLYTRTEKGTLVKDRILVRLPVIGKVVMNSNMFTLTSALASLIDAGVPPVEALRLSGEGLSSSVLRRSLVIVTRETSEGKSLGKAFRDQEQFPRLLSQGIATGEATGNLTGILHGLANYYEQETDRSVSNATDMIQPTVILLVAGAVGFVAVAVISGIYSTLGAIE
ncbi:MAG: type II secretion system F family protein [Chloroflexi bacterium]|nr:type II secretion system F family protein [Chloroflexota bacterium]